MTTTTTRIFKYNGRTIPDPGPEHTVEAVRSALIPYFPELAHSRIDENSGDDGTQIIEFVKQAGTKG